MSNSGYEQRIPCSYTLHSVTTSSVSVYVLFRDDLPAVYKARRRRDRLDGG